jgi:hypothetical protein
LTLRLKPSMRVPYNMNLEGEKGKKRKGGKKKVE